MIEIVFSDSACGSLKAAQRFGKGSYIGGAADVIVSHEDGSAPAEEEIRETLRRADEAEKRAWENAVPLGGDPADVYGFHLALSVGDISGNGMDSRRQKALRELYRIYPDDGDALAEELLKGAEDALREACEKAAAGEGLRVWYSCQPDELCGLYWFMAQLERLRYTGEVTWVKLPEWEEKEDGAVVEMSSWGETAPGEWGRFLPFQRPVPSALRRQCAARWQELQAENAPLRAVLNGRLVSVREDIYDSFLLREIEAEPEEFQEAVIIGRVLGKYRLGVSDAFIARRIGKMIRDGKLAQVTQPPQTGPVYHCILKKANWP